MRQDIAKISTYAFMTMAEKKDYQVPVLLLKDFEKLNVQINTNTLLLISDLGTITLKDDDKYLTSIWTKLYTKK